MLKDMVGMKAIAWFRLVFKLRGSVIPAILTQVLLCAAFGCLVAYIHQRGGRVSYPALAGVIPSIVVGLLLVFRTNTAYERYWEGRKLWGSIVNLSRNLGREIWLGVTAPTAAAQVEKIATLRLLAAFAIATKLFLRHQAPNAELQPLLPDWQYAQLHTVEHPPLRLALWLESYLQSQYRQGQITMLQLTRAEALIEKLVDALGGCERILKTPMPLAYAIHLKQLLLLYCLLLPFGFVEQLGWWTGIVVGIISFTLFGVEAIGIEIENPFGCDPNDLPLNAICQTIQRNLEELMAAQGMPSPPNATPELEDLLESTLSSHQPKGGSD
jgi:ion channel-forming bestrophin family protein